LVVISIIGILVGLLLPAVQSARESARRMQCSNHLKQLSLGAIQHNAAHGFWPSGGWGWHWSGDPDRGYGKTQPGGWAYSILPYVEQQNVHDMGMGTTEATRKAQQALAVGVPIPFFNCPTRRPCRPRPFVHSQDFKNINDPPKVQRTDYAINAGDGGPDTDGANEHAGPGNITDASAFTAFTSQNGIVAIMSETKSGHIKDGLSNTYLIGERYLNIDGYETGKASDDDQHQYVGFDRDSIRFGSVLPVRDAGGAEQVRAFGSAHSGNWQMSFCDGSVRSMSYQIDAETHRRLANRKDLLPVDASKY
jgi:hypothetical protein